VDLVQGLNEDFVDSMIDTFADVARENKNFWDAVFIHRSIKTRIETKTIGQLNMLSLSKNSY